MHKRNSIYGNPTDLWEHYFKPELKSEADTENRKLMLELTAKYGIDWVWEHRRRLVALMLYFVIDLAGERSRVASC